MISIWLVPAALMLAGTALAQGTPAQEAVPAADATASASQVKVECVSASEAAQLKGHEGCVAGKVYRINVSKNGHTHLHLCATGSKGCSFDAIIEARDHKQVGDLNGLRGRMVAVTGPVSEFRGHPRIKVTEREQIHICASDTPPQYDADRAAPPSSTKGLRGVKHERIQ